MAGPNNLKLVYTVSKIEKHDFEYISKYLVTHINGVKSDKNIKLVLSLISNTFNNTTIIEYRLEYEKESDYDYIMNLVDIKLLQNTKKHLIFFIILKI